MQEEIRKTIYNPSGSSRQRRLLPALDSEYFKVDDRTLADFLVFTEKYAAQVHTHRFPVDSRNEGNEQDSWRAFFYSDISVFLAKLASIDLTELTPFYLKEDLAGGEESLRAILQKKLTSVMHVVSVITDSYYPILHIHGGDPDARQLIDYIEQIRRNRDLEEIIRLVQLLSIKVENTSILHPNYQSIWGNHLIVSEPLKDLNEVKKAIEYLNKSINSFLVIAGQLVHYSKSFFWETVYRNQNHNPGTALFIAFLRLYHFLQKDLNSITGKHLDYFYKELLQQKIKSSSPDHVHVCFSLADHADSCAIEKGTLFKAGIDSEGYDLLYAAEDYLMINRTKITDLGAVFLSQKEEVGLENSYEFISDIYQSEIFTSAGGGFDFSYNPVSFSSFEKNRANPDFKTIKVSEVGFAIASPILLLSEGKRECDLILNFGIKSMSTLLSFLERYTVNEGSTFDRAFHKLFSRAFDISLSTGNGWYQLEDYKLFSPDSETGSFKISFVLPMGAPSITPMGEKWDKKEVELYNTEWPVIKLCLTNRRSMLVYSYLRDLILTECSIQVSVTGVKNLQVFNDLGQLDINNPFFPFGALPVLGSSLLIGNAELYKKKIEDFSFDLTWYNLPRTKGGFKYYYKEYDPKIENDSFKVGVTALSDFEFHPTVKEETQQFSLFSATEEMDGQLPVLNQTTTLKGFDIGKLRMNADYSSVEFPPYDNKARSGYIKLELLSPEMSFGQSIYPSLFSSKIMKGAKSSNIEIPNPPYLPQLKSVTLNYKASTTISFQATSFMKSDPKANEKVYILHPFGVQPSFKNNIPLSDKFLPQYFHNGYLILGLDTVVLNEPLTLHFILDPSLGNEFEVELPQVHWFYISDNKWIEFDKKSLVFDTTKNFTTTGIVKLMMPKVMDNQNNLLPPGKFWIVAAIKGDLGLIGKIKGIYTQAMKLIWTPHKENATWSKSIPPNIIESLVQPKPEIAGIFQPLPSFGGSDQEKPVQFYNRVSERLRHRNRCITTWDYERMVLEKFPFVHQVKCISPVIEEGNVILVVVPEPGKADDLIFPRFNYSILQEIKDCVEKYASPFARIQVINPVYEEVKISASIKFKEHGQEGTGIENLHRDLRNFICPWHSDASKEMEFGGFVNLDELENFIRTRPYVSFVTNLSVLILHYHDKNYSISDSVVATLEDKTLYASKPWVVLIPMKHQPISIIETDVYISPGQAAVENLRIGNEFVLVDKKKEKEVKKEFVTPKMDSGNYMLIDIEL